MMQVSESEAIPKSDLVNIRHASNRNTSVALDNSDQPSTYIKDKFYCGKPEGNFDFYHSF
jgi:hypothetical protein